MYYFFIETNCEINLFFFVNEIIRRHKVEQRRAATKTLKFSLIIFLFVVHQ